MDEEQEATRRFIAEILRATGWKPSQLAKRAKVAHTTLTRFLNGEVSHTLSMRTLHKIRRASGAAIPPDQLDHLWLLSQRRPGTDPERPAKRA